MKLTQFLLSILLCVVVISAQQSVRPLETQSKQPEVYVIGKVGKASTIPWQESLTLMQAIRLSGGIQGSEKKMKAFITRHISKCKSIDITINLKDIINKKRNDFFLNSSDFIQIGSKKVFPGKGNFFDIICFPLVPVSD